jgi:hypothetical protein
MTGRRDAGPQRRARTSRTLGAQDPRWDRTFQQETNPDEIGDGLRVDERGRQAVNKARRPELTGDAEADLATLIRYLAEAGLMED